MDRFKSQNIEKPTILIVDDTKVNLDILEKVLSNIEFHIIRADNGRDALKILQEVIPDLILLDVIMPEMDGFELCRRIKENEKLISVPIIFITGMGESNDITQGFEAGAADYITKPFNISELKSRVKVHIELKKSKQDLESALNDVKSDLELTKLIQQHILTVHLSENLKKHCVVKYLPMIEVGGDFYDIDEIKPGVCRVFLADAIGHGIQGALVTMAIKGIYEDLKNKYRTPDKLLNILNKQFIQKYESIGTFFTCICADINLNTSKIVFSSGGHNEQLLVKSEGEIINLKSKGSILGIDNQKKYSTKILSFNKNDKLLLFTDGLLDQNNPKQEFFGDIQFIPFIEENYHLNIHSFTDALFNKSYEHVSDEKISDDITYIGFEMP